MRIHVPRYSPPPPRCSPPLLRVLYPLLYVRVFASPLFLVQKVTVGLAPSRRRRLPAGLRVRVYLRTGRLSSTPVTVTNDALSIRIVRREGENGEHLLALCIFRRYAFANHPSSLYRLLQTDFLPLTPATVRLRTLYKLASMGTQSPSTRFQPAIPYPVACSDRGGWDRNDSCIQMGWTSTRSRLSRNAGTEQVLSDSLGNRSR